MQDIQHDPIAIIGIGCRFPKAGNPQEFWQLLSEGRNAVSEVPAERWDIDAIYDPDPALPGKTVSRWGGFLEQVDQFDWRAFHLLPREVKQMDPQQRLLLEVTWEALEDAGLTFEQIAGSNTGVSIGISWNDYFHLLTQNPLQLDAYTAIGNAMCFAANRLSYTFDLKGPSVSMDAGCTSSLMSVYHACQSLWNGEATLALAGGVNLILSPDLTIMLSQADFLARDGQCKTLDERADGFVRGEGAGIVVLKPLSHVTSSDRVYALIRGIATNHNGHNQWIIASSRQAQEALLRTAYTRAGVDPAEVDYVELNGTAFSQGDAIEAQALGAVLGNTEKRAHPCLVGSVKTNIGHLESAAGIAALIKVALSLHHQQIPPTLNLQKTNPAIALQSLQLAAQQEMTPWPAKTSTPFAGVTALSMSGVNTHAVLAAYPVRSSADDTCSSTRLLPVSARSAEALVAQATALRDFLSAADPAPGSFWPDVCYTASVRRSHHPYRLAVSGSSAQEAARALDVCIQEQRCPRRASRQRKLVFLCTQQSGPARSLVEDAFLLANPAFRAVVEDCKRVIHELTQRSLAEIVCASEGTGSERQAANEVLHFIHQVGLAALWHSWNIVPGAVLGEGLGEIAAAYIAGVLTLEDALHILFDAGKWPALLTPQGSAWHPRRQSAAPTCSLYSSMPDSPSAEEDADLAAWIVQLPGTKVSSLLLDQVLADSNEVFLDPGLSSPLATHIAVHAQETQRSVTLLASSSQEKDTEAALLETLGTFYMQGHTIHWHNLYAEERTCISLPTYQWQRERFWPAWLENTDSAPASESQRPGEPACSDQAITADQHEELTAVPVPLSEVEPEQRLLTMWRELFDMEQIGPHDNFFTLGGTSLLVGQLLARLYRIFRVKLSVATIFEHPTIAELATLIKQSTVASNDTQYQARSTNGQQYDEQLLSIVDYLTNEEIAALVGKREALAHLLQAKISGQKMFPLSFAQRRLWFLHQLQNGSPVYHVVVAYRIQGKLELAALQRSLDEIVRRHETLRTTFPAIDGQPMQIIVPGATVDLAQEDLEMFPAEQRAAETLRRATEELKKPFDLEEGPLMRTRLLRLSASEHILLLNVHHIIFDGWSMRVFYRELAALYESFAHGKRLTLPELPIQYLDYTAWERKWLQSEALETNLAYWKQQLAGAPPALNLPTDYPRPPLETFRGAYEAFMLPSSQLMGLKELGQRERVTLFMTLLTAFQVLLAHDSQQDDIVVGTDVANRSQVEVENLIGFFVNQLVLRCDLSGNPSLSDLLQRVRRVVLDAYDHQDVPFDQLVRALNPVRFPDRAPIFQAKMVLQNMPLVPAGSAITVDPLLVDAGAAQLDLILDLTETEEGLRALWQYNTDLFDVSSVKRMNQQFSSLLQAFVATPTHTLSSLYTLLEQSEGGRQVASQHTMPGNVVQGRQDVLRNGSLASALEEQAERTPDNVALLMQGREITYAQLNARANKLASQLQKRGVQPETMVVLCTERSLETIIGFFGIFKAGGVCVSLDPAYPKDRWAFIVQDSQARVVVTQSKLASSFSEYGLEVVDLEMLDSWEEAENPTCGLDGEHLAYVMYTSGSTGQPKGVGVSHKAALNHCLAMRHEFALDEHDRILQFYSLAFDGSLEQFFPGLFCGATIVMRGATSWSVAELNEAVREQKLTVVNLTPALWQQWSQEMVKEPAAVHDAQLRLVIVGAEAMTPEALRCWQQTPLATRHLINAYGPTEAVITAITFDVPEQFCPEEGSYTVPIGRPLPYREIYILNPQGKQVFPGTTGELYIGGPLLARGYLNRPDLTAERFVPNPFSSVPGSRLYRTGDLARYLSDGTIEYLGRVDQQVKVRGFRIELGEIETVLQQHPGVQTAIVVAREDNPGEKRLVAYALLQVGHIVTVPELRTFLADRLPAYMMPSAFVRLDTLPLTANGKIDRRALPAPEFFRPDVGETFVAPRNATEEMLAKIWSEVLVLEQVGIHDNFFELGGHSLVAIQTIARVRAAFQVDLPVHILFLEPTVAKFAAKIVEAKNASQELALPAITRRRRDGGVRSSSQSVR